MSSLSERLKALGVEIGTQGLPKPKTDLPPTLESVLSGRAYETLHGETFLVEEHYPLDQPHGNAGLCLRAPLGALAQWAKERRLASLPAESFAFLDTETTGLSGGTGTYAFLIGIGRFEGDEFHLAQFFMRDPIEEPAQLFAVEEFLAPCEAVVTFNGKTFDIPLLQTRFLTHGWRPPFTDLAHVDLLHLARKLWPKRLPSRALGYLEAHILETSRSEEDVPGWLIPSLYFDYLREGDARSLKSVFYHNAMDVLSLAALLNHTAGLLSSPLEKGSHHGVDLIALARLFEDLGDLEGATRLYIHGLEHDDALSERVPVNTLLDAIQRLAMIYKRQENFTEATALWKRAAQYSSLHAHLELAKYNEHRSGDNSEAIFWTESAIALVESTDQNTGITPSLTALQRQQWLEELHHRLNRLQLKLSSSE